MKDIPTEYLLLIGGAIVFVIANIGMYLTSDRSENIFKYLYHQYF